MAKRMGLASALLFVLVTLVSWAQATKSQDASEVESRVSQVIVYPQWAYVTREAKVSLPAGTSRFVFKGLPSWIDEDSIRVRTAAPDAVLIIGAGAETVFLTRSHEDEVLKAEEAVRQLQDQVTDLKSELASLAEERKYLENLSPWKLGKSPQESAPRPVSIAELRELKSLIQQETLANLKKQNQVQRRIRDIEPELSAKEKIWQTMKSRGRLEQRDIVVELEAKSALKTTLAISYLISGASWYPSYDARVNSEQSRVDFVCKAVVQQSTGEDWSGASFVLSTIQPYRVREKPRILPWYVNASTAGDQSGMENSPSGAIDFRSESSGEQNEKMMAIQKKQQVDLKGMDEESQKAYAAYNDNYIQAQKVVRQVEERGTTVEFAVANTYTVKSDGKPVHLPIGTADLEAVRRYSAAPAVSKSTYVTGQMRNLAPFVFLPGPVKVYVDGSFIGKSELNCIAQGESFELYLGLEERIQVTRELDKRNSSTRSANERKRLQVAYTIEVKNYLKQPVAIEVRDQIPVSQDSNVKVKLMELEPSVEAIDKGVITWPLTLQAGETKLLRFEFQMDYPANIYLRNAVELERILEIKE